MKPQISTDNKARVQESLALHNLLGAPGLLARWPIIGLLMMLVGGFIFTLLAYQVESQGVLLQWDIPVDNYLHAMALSDPAYIQDFFKAGFYVGREAIIAIGVFLGAYYLVKRYWAEMAMVAIGWGGGGLLWFIFENFFNRPRPSYTHTIGFGLKTGSFPSGHTLTSFICYGFVAYLLAAHVPSRFWKWIIIVAAIVIMLYIGFSRLYVGGHYLTDVIAGYGLGMFWSSLVFTSIELYCVRRSNGCGGKK